MLNKNNFKMLNFCPIFIILGFLKAKLSWLTANMSKVYLTYTFHFFYSFPHGKLICFISYLTHTMSRLFRHFPCQVDPYFFVFSFYSFNHEKFANQMKNCKLHSTRQSFWHFPCKWYYRTSHFPCRVDPCIVIHIFLLIYPWEINMFHIIFDTYNEPPVLTFPMPSWPLFLVFSFYSFNHEK